MCGNTDKSPRLIIDFGANLSGTDEKSTIPDSEMFDRVFANGDKPAAVLFTHYHSDCIGLVDKIPNDIPTSGHASIDCKKID